MNVICGPLHVALSELPDFSLLHEQQVKSWWPFSQRWLPVSLRWLHYNIKTDHNHTPLWIKYLPFLPDWAIILPADCWRPHCCGHFLWPCSCAGSHGYVACPQGWCPQYPGTIQSLGVAAAGRRWLPPLTLVLQGQLGGWLQTPQKNMLIHTVARLCTLYYMEYMEMKFHTQSQPGSEQVTNSFGKRFLLTARSVWSCH